MKKSSSPQDGAAAEAASGERIAKVMARAGLCSRREAERWIEAGRVAVNGITISSAALNVAPDDQVTVDGSALPEREAQKLWRYHKPSGLLVSHGDPKGRPTVFEKLGPDMPRVVSVGRLDFNTEGLLLLTNDGELARLLELPATGWVRRYRVRAHGRIEPQDLEALKDGITIDGVAYGPIEARLERVQGGNLWLSFALREGRNREIKKICEHLGLQVNRLIRVSYGPFQLGELKRGGIEQVSPKVLREQLGRGVSKSPQKSQQRKKHAHRRRQT